MVRDAPTASTPRLRRTTHHEHAPPPLLGSWTATLAVVVVFRAANALLLRTAFNPDEHWQSTEVAAAHVFGRGHLTWEWIYELRSFAFPSLFAIIFRVLKTLGLASSSLVVIAPKLLQATFAAANDLLVYLLAFHLFGLSTARIALLFSLTLWFNYFAAVRTLSNVLEATITTAAIYHWLPLIASVRGQGSLPINKLCKAIFICALGPVIRSSNVFVWVYFYALLFISLRRTDHFLAIIVITASAIALALGLELAIDYSFYGHFVFPHLKFLQFNLVDNINSFYGNEPWHWYLTSGLPTVMGPLVLLVPYAMKVAVENRAVHSIVWFCSYFVFCLSFITHKEFRFLFPILPLILVYCGYLYTRITIERPVYSRFLLTTIISINVVLSLYFGSIHQRGVMDAADYLRDNYGEVDGVLFLMPCHSTPYYGYINLNIPMKFLTCEPPLRENLDPKVPYDVGLTTYITESDLYHHDPAEYFRKFAYPYVGNKTINNPQWENYGHSPHIGRKEVRAVDNTNVFVPKLEWYTHIVVYESWLLEDGPGNEALKPVIPKTAGYLQNILQQSKLVNDLANIFPKRVFEVIYNATGDLESAALTTYHNILDDPQRFMKTDPKRYGNYALWSILNGSDYRECARFLNSNIRYEELRYGDVVVYCRRESYD